MVKIALLAFGASSLAMVLSACGTDATNVDGCRRIEEARCRRATSCGLDLDRIVHVGKSSDDAVSGCIRYYHEACLHGTVVAQDPGGDAVNACVSAVTNGSCDVVKAPESSSSCSWLVPPPPAAAPADAGATPSDAGSDGGV